MCGSPSGAGGGAFGRTPPQRTTPEEPSALPQPPQNHLAHRGELLVDARQRPLRRVRRVVEAAGRVPDGTGGDGRVAGGELPVPYAVRDDARELPDRLADMA